MGAINIVLGVPLGYLVYFAYMLTGNYGIAILLFTVLVKLIMYPVNVFTHKNSIRLLQIQPQLNIIKRRFAGDKNQINEEQYALYQKEKYNPMVGFIPLLVQIVLIIGVLQVMYNPLQHILHLDGSVIETLVEATRSLLGVQGGSGEQLRVIDAISRPENLQYYTAALSGVSGADSILQQIAATNLKFLGINLGHVPSFANPSLELLVPFIAGGTSFAFCMVQNAISPGAISQGKAANWGMTIFTVAFTLYFTLVVPVGVGVYWTANNLLSICVAFIRNKVQNPRIVASEAIAQIEAAKKTPEQRKKERIQNKQLAKRSNTDAQRFATAKKHIVFYALTSGQYKYYRLVIEYILANSDITIHYLTNDPEDSLFRQAQKGIVPYYLNQQKTISSMLKLEADMLITTVPDLQTFYIKRSIVQDDIEYIFIPHALVGSHVSAREKAFDYYDTLFLTGPHRIADFRRREEMANLKKKNLVKVGYGFYDQLIEAYSSVKNAINKKPRILIAPSWQAKNIMELCIDEVLAALTGKGYEIVVRPHPQEMVLFPERIEILMKKYAENVADGEIKFELDFSDSKSIFTSDVLITDWSNIAFEFSYCTLKPCIFINTPMKILNPNYEDYGLEIPYVLLRDKVGISVDTDKLAELSEITTRLLKDKDRYKAQITEVVEQNLYYPGRSGEAGGKYILGRLKKKGVL